MSTQPQNYTHTTIKDFDFQRKYKLTPSQTDIMSYIRGLPSWAFVRNNHYVLTTNKIEDDLKIATKTIESSLTRLKKLKLITTELVLVEEWSKKKKFRGIKITDLGIEYNLNFWKPKEEKVIVDLKMENKKLKEDKKLREIELQELRKESEIKSEQMKKLQDELNEERKKAKKICQTTPQNQGQIDPLESRGNNSSILGVNKDFNREEEKTATATNKSNLEDNREESFFKLKLETSRRFGTSNLPICNAVEGWDSETEFVINSYNKLSVITPDGKYKQLANPKEINNFWEWLYQNQDRIGDVKRIDNEELKSLMFFIGFCILLNERIYTIHNFQKVQDGVKVQLKNSLGDIIKIKNPNQSEILNIEDTKKWLENKAFRE